jgi:hypothetical protein
MGAATPEEEGQAGQRQIAVEDEIAAPPPKRGKKRTLIRAGA